MTATVLVVPVALLTLLFVVQFGLAYHARHVLAGATQDGAAAAARPGAGPTDGADLARQLIADTTGTLLAGTAVVATQTASAVTVAADAKVVSLLPFLSGITVRASATAKLETFDPQGTQP